MLRGVLLDVAPPSMCGIRREESFRHSSTTVGGKQSDSNVASKTSRRTALNIRPRSSNPVNKTIHNNGRENLNQFIIFEVKTSLAGFGRKKKSIARASTRIEFQEAMIRFSKLGFPVAHGEFLRLQYEDYI